MKSKLFFAALLILVIIGVISFWLCGLKQPLPKDITGLTWRSFKHAFINESGQVIRRQEADTVSEGQAYAMLRAVWMRDKNAFDRCYLWTEAHLSRTRIGKDNLLAWHYKDGRVLDWMPASDADCDYALALIFANALWPGRNPPEARKYGEKASAVLSDVLSFETERFSDGRIYLLPWIVEDGGQGARPLNPSYFSPAYFKVFFSFTKDKRWQELVDTSYYLWEELSQAGPLPDWCAFDSHQGFIPLKGKSNSFGWDAIRIPLKAGIDYSWFQDNRAKNLLCPYFSSLKDSVKEGVVTGPLFYASYAIALKVCGSPLAALFIQKVHQSITKVNGYWFYGRSDYYTSSLAWFPDGLERGIIKNCLKEKVL